MKIRFFLAEAQGHTDERGTIAYNQERSEKMAENTIKYLIYKGISPERVVAKGFGEVNPKYPDSNSEENHQLNRRVDIVITINNDQNPTLPADTIRCLEFSAIKDAIAQRNPARVCSLYVSSPEVCDFNMISRFVNLKFLSLEGVQVKNFPAISSLQNLETFHCTGVIGRTSAIQAQQNVPDRISGTDLSNLTRLQKLRILHINGTRVQHPEAISELPNLKELQLIDNNLGDIKFLTDIIGLQFITISSNNLTDISPLERMITLFNLNLSKNRIDNVTPLIKLINLETLDLSENQISDISPFTELKNLQLLNVKGNRIPVEQVRRLQNSLKRIRIESDISPGDSIMPPSQLRLR